MILSGIRSSSPMRGTLAPAGLAGGATSADPRSGEAEGNCRKSHLPTWEIRKKSAMSPMADRSLSGEMKGGMPHGLSQVVNPEKSRLPLPRRNSEKTVAS